MPDALIGYTGFVGGNLLRQRPFDERFRSTDIDRIRGRAFDTLVCAGAPAAKWKANQDPDADRANLRRLADALAAATARRVVLISTIDVYPHPVGVDEETPIDPAAATAYGRHRHELERFLSDRFDTVIVRLPGLFGDGLKKNVIYDLLHDHLVEQINPASVFQYYWLGWLWGDVRRILEQGLKVVNLVTPPLRTADLAGDVFGRTLPPLSAPPALYDCRSRHGYVRGAGEVLAALRAFVAAERGRWAA